MLVDPNLIPSADGRLRETLPLRRENKSPRKVTPRQPANDSQDNPARRQGGSPSQRGKIITTYV